MTVRDERSEAHADHLISETRALYHLSPYRARASAQPGCFTSLHWLEFDEVGPSILSSDRETEARDDGLEQAIGVSRMFNLGKNTAIFLL